MELLYSIAPLVGLLFFFFVFIGIAFWALRPRMKAKLQSYALIPLKEDNHG